MPAGAFLITDVSPGFDPMLAQVTLHTGEKYPISAQPVVAMAKDCCTRITPVEITKEPLPEGGEKIKRIKRVGQPF